MRRRSLVAVLCLFAVVGCAPGAEVDEVESGEDAIRHDEAAERLNLKERVMEDVEPSPANAVKLGIKAWNVYTSIDAKFNGVVAFATDAEGDVAYAMVYDTATKEATILEYDKQGQKDGRLTISEETQAALQAEFAMLRDEALRRAAARAGSDVSTRGLSDGANCGLRVAAAALGAVAFVGLAWGGAALGVAAVTYGSAMALFAAGTITVSAGAVGAVVAIVATKQWDETVTACKAAVKKN